jgi:hypothetical protein|tara:strand:- start:34 stop:192 length:159 start_codon:yes stop_codon:yes gene_type:complete
MISAIPGLNPSGGFPSETVQFYHRDKIVIPAKLSLALRQVLYRGKSENVFYE